MSNSNLIDIRMKLTGGRAVVSGLTGTRKETEKLGSATSKASKVSKIATGATGRLTTAYKELGTHAKLALGLVGAGSLFAAESAINATEELGKTTSGLARNFDLQNNVASRWAAVATSREIDSKSLGMTFTTLSKQMTTAAREGGKALLPFHQLGISQEEAAKGAHDFEWGIMRVAKALGEEEGGAKRAAAAKALLGKGSATLLPLFSEGTKGLKEQLKWADEYGVTLSGKTTEGIMDMVSAQRQNKVAMLGLQVSLTRFLMPAINKGDEELQAFIKTLNDPHMSAEQKIEKIGKQFQGLEGEIITVIERALPKVAEESGRLGLVMARSIGNAFLHASAVGKLAIAAYVFNLFGGKELAKAGARKVGGQIGTEMGLGLALGAIGAFVGYEIGEHLSEKTKVEIYNWGVHAGEWFVNGLINLVNEGIREVNSAMNEANVFSFLGVSAPQIGEIGGVQVQTGTPGLREQEEEAHKHLKEGLIDGPGGKPVRPANEPHHKHHKKASPQSLILPDTAFGGTGTTHVHLYLARNDKEIASAVLGPAQRRAALK